MKQLGEGEMPVSTTVSANSEAIESEHGDHFEIVEGKKKDSNSSSNNNSSNSSSSKGY